MKPSEYKQPFALMQATPYEITDPLNKELLPGSGVLGVGQILWLAALPAVRAKPQAPVKAYVEGIGVIFIDSRFLAPLKHW